MVLYLRISWFLNHWFLGSIQTIQDRETERSKCVPDKDLFHTGYPSTGTIFAPEQDCCAPLLKVECPVMDRFLKRSGPNLNPCVGAEIVSEVAFPV